jgi:putative hemolysin
MITIGAAIPIFLCWALPNMLAAQRVNQGFAEATATRSAIVAFRAEHPEYFALCDSPEGSLATGEMPSLQTILVLQNGAISDFQVDIPSVQQPVPDADPTMIVCLSMERSQPMEECADGSKPDLSLFQPQGGGQGNPIAPQQQIAMTHFATIASVYNLQTGELIAQEMLYGSDPTYCSNPDGSLVGERLTKPAFQEWLARIVQ